MPQPYWLCVEHTALQAPRVISTTCGYQHKLTKGTNIMHAVDPNPACTCAMMHPATCPRRHCCTPSQGLDLRGVLCSAVAVMCDASTSACPGRAIWLSRELQQHGAPVPVLSIHSSAASVKRRPLHNARLTVPAVKEEHSQHPVSASTRSSCQQ
jgi:hypothetical protein